MGLETATYVSDLVETNPVSGDTKGQGDNHIRLIKTALKNTFPNADKEFTFPRVAAEESASRTILEAEINTFIPINATAAPVSMTLPALAPGSDLWAISFVRVDNTPANALTIVGTVNGVANYLMPDQWDTVTFIWDGALWYAFRSQNRNILDTASIAEIRAKVAAKYLTVQNRTLSEEWVDLGNKTGAVTIDCDTGTKFMMTMTGNVTVDVSNLDNGQKINIAFIQNAAGGWTVAWNAKFAFPGANAPYGTKTANAFSFAVEAEGSWDPTTLVFARDLLEKDPLSASLLHVRNQQASNTAGAALTVAAWTARVLNTTVTNEIAGASRAGNQITLPAGTYEIDASATFVNNTASSTLPAGQVRFRDTTAGATLLNGFTTNFGAWNSSVPSGSTNNGGGRAKVAGRFTLAAQGVCELQYYTNGNSATEGVALNSGETEVYADVKIRRIK